MFVSIQHLAWLEGVTSDVRRSRQTGSDTPKSGFLPVMRIHKLAKDFNVQKRTSTLRTVLLIKIDHIQLIRKRMKAKVYNRLF